MFASESDYKNKTHGRVILELEIDDEKIKSDLIKLNGKYTHIEGVYRSFIKDRIQPDTITICKGFCGATGYIEVKSIFN